MIKKFYTRRYLFLVPFVLFSCNSDLEEKDYIVVPEDATEDFRHIVSDLQLVPLEESGNHLLGSIVEIRKCDDSYILFDKKNSKLFRFAADGHFINSIGIRGNGPEEYLNITNIQVLNGYVVVFSYPSKILFFSPDGAFVKSETVERMGLNSYLVDNRLLSYYGYSGEKQCRLWYKGIDSSKIDDGFLHYDKSVIDLGLENNMFADRIDGSVFVLDSYSNVVSVFDGKDLSPYVTFDFGNYSIDKKFFETKDPFEGAERYILNGNYSIIYKFVTSESTELVQIERKKSTDEMIHTIFGIKRTSWEWYSFLEDKSYGDLYEPFQFIEGDTIYGVVNPDQLPAFLELYKPLASNWDMVDNAISEDNHVIVKYNLK